MSKFSLRSAPYVAADFDGTVLTPPVLYFLSVYFDPLSPLQTWQLIAYFSWKVKRCEPPPSEISPPLQNQPDDPSDLARLLTGTKALMRPKLQETCCLQKRAAQAIPNKDKMQKFIWECIQDFSYFSVICQYSHLLRFHICDNNRSSISAISSAKISLFPKTSFQAEDGRLLCCCFLSLLIFNILIFSDFYKGCSKSAQMHCKHHIIIQLHEAANCAKKGGELRPPVHYLYTSKCVPFVLHAFLISFSLSSVSVAFVSFHNCSLVQCACVKFLCFFLAFI